MTDPRDRAVEALRNLMPVIEKAMAGLVFTADMAGVVAADMNALRAALAAVDAAPRPLPPLPDQVCIKHLMPHEIRFADSVAINGYTADQMLAYAEAALAAYGITPDPEPSVAR